jgi:nucleoid-associated protein YgaU
MNGSKFAAIAVVVLLAAAGLYYAFIAPSSRVENAPAGANGLGTTSPSNRPAVTPPLRTIGAAPSPNASTPALRALGGETPANGFAGAGATATPTPTPTPTPTTIAGNGAPTRTEQPTFAPGSLGDGGVGKGDAAPTKAPTRLAGNGFGNGFDAPITAQPSNTAAPVSGSPTPVPSDRGTTTTPTTPVTPTTLAGNGGATRPVTTGPTTTPTSAPSPATAPRSTPTTSDSTHTVASGETMSSIAKRYFGSENKWTLIAKANPSVDPSSMKVGAKLRIPSQGAISLAGGSGTTTTPKSAGSTPGATAAGGNHVIASGETLSSLARKYYGSTKHWRKIYEANKSTIGSDPAALKVGQSLVIPSRTAVVGAENVER